MSFPGRGAASAEPGRRAPGPARGRDRTGVHSVTTAAAPRSEDRSARMRVYVLQMGLRTACFVGALFAHGWWQLVLILGAVVLPYVAVVSVNNAGPQAGGTLREVPAPGPALTATPSPAAAPQEPVVLAGVVVDDDAGPRRALPAARGPEPRA